MEIKLIIFILITFVIQTTVSQASDESIPTNNATNLSEIDWNPYEVNENETIRTKRHPALLLKTRPIRLKRLPITTVYRRYPTGHPPPSKYGASQTSQNLSPPKIRYGPLKHKPSHPIGIEYSPSSDYLDSYGKPYSSISDASSHHDILNGYQETHLVDTNSFDSYESYKTPLHFSSNSQSSNYEYYPSHQPSIPINNHYNSDSSGSSVVSSGSSVVSSSSSGSKLKFPSHQPEMYNENLNSDSYSGTYYPIPSTSYGVPSNTYGEGHAQQPQEQQYSSYTPQYQSHSQGNFNYQPSPVQHNPVPAHNSHSAVSYSPPAETYNYQPAQQTPISHKPSPNYQQNSQQGTYNFAEPPQSNKPHHQVPPQSNPVYSNSVTSYNPPANYPGQHQPSTKLQGAYNTPVPVYTTKKRPRATTKQTPNDNIIYAPTENYDFQLDESDNSASLYDTSISSYDVPVHYNYIKDQKSPKFYPPNENFEPKPKKVPSPPMLPNIYDQEEFSSFKKSKNEPSKKRQHDLQDFSQFFDAAVFQPHSTQRPKKRTKYSSSRPPIMNLNAFASYEDILSTTEQYFDEPTTIRSTSTTANPRFRRKKLTKPPYITSSSSSNRMNHHNLDTDDLRDAYGSPTHIHSSVIRSDAIAKFESMKNKNRLPPPIKSIETKTKGTNNSTKYHSKYSTKQADKYEVVSIEKSKSHSYYAGTMAPSLAVNSASKRHYDVAESNKHKTKHYDDDEDETGSDTKAFNVFSSGFYVSDGSVADVSDSSENDFNSDYYDNEDDFDATYKDGRGVNTRKPIWSGGSLPKNHKFTSNI